MLFRLGQDETTPKPDGSSPRVSVRNEHHSTSGFPPGEAGRSGSLFRPSGTPQRCGTRVVRLFFVLWTPMMVGATRQPPPDAGPRAGYRGVHPPPRSGPAVRCSSLTLHLPTRAVCWPSTTFSRRPFERVRSSSPCCYSDSSSLCCDDRAHRGTVPPILGKPHPERRCTSAVGEFPTPAFTNQSVSRS